MDFSLPAPRLIRSLDQVIERRGKPAVIRCDNGPEYISGDLHAWAQNRSISIEYIQPRKPQQASERMKRRIDSERGAADHQPALCHGRTGVRQPAPQQGAAALHVARAREGGLPVEAVLPGAHHREAGAPGVWEMSVSEQWTLGAYHVAPIVDRTPRGAVEHAIIIASGAAAPESGGGL